MTDSVDRKRRRKIRGVQPPPIVNRRTGETKRFGPRRAYSGAWVCEMLGASGCTKAEVEAAIFVLEPLLEHHVKIDKGLLGLLIWFPNRRPGTRGGARSFT